MSLPNLKPNVKQTRKRVGRGNASGHGTYSCRGMNGQSSRSGGRVRPGFEGGQTSYFMKMPKLKGFKNPNKVDYQAVNVGDLNIFEDGATIDAQALLSKNLIAKKSEPIKLLGGKGKLEKKLTILVHKASASAVEQVKTSKGELKLLIQETTKEEEK